MREEKEGVRLILSDRDKYEAVKTHLEDLQAEMEWGARNLEVLARTASALREAILRRHLDQAAIASALINRVRDLQRSVQQQREQVREIRRAIRERREQRLAEAKARRASGACRSVSGDLRTS